MHKWLCLVGCTKGEDGEPLGQRHHNGFTMMLHVTEHPELTKHLSVDMYGGVCSPMQSQAELLQLCKRQRTTLTLGQKFTFAPIYGAGFAFTNGLFHSAADSRHAIKSDRPRTMLYAQVNYQDKEEDLWDGEQSVAKWKTSWKHVSKGLVAADSAWEYAEVMRDIPSTQKQYKATRRQLGMTRSEFMRRAAMSVVSKRLRGSARLRSAQPDEDEELTLDFSRIPSFDTLDRECRAVFKRKGAKRMKVKDVLDALNAERSTDNAIEKGQFEDIFKGQEGKSHYQWRLLGGRLAALYSSDEE